MSETTTSTGWSACTSALRLDRWLCGELPADEAEALRRHVAGCGRCSATAAELEAQRERELPPLRALRETPPASARRPGVRGWLPWLAGAGAAVAAAMVLAVRPGTPGTPETPGTALKGGGVGVSMYVQHGGEVRRARDGEALGRGDAIRFAVTTPVRAYVAILSLDPQGRASVYFPLGPRAEPFGPAVDAPLPVGTRLDGTAGEERIWTLFCSSPVELEPVRARLEQTGDATAFPPECQVSPWRFVKR